MNDMKFIYDLEKNAKLLSTRNIGFEEIIQAIANEQLLDIKDHHNQVEHKDQKILYIRILDEVYAVPFIKDKQGRLLLKTIFPSRKARKYYLQNNDQI